MPLIDMRDMLQHAYRHGYAVGAFDLVSLGFLQGIMMAAEQARAPVVLSLAESHFDYFDFELVIHGGTGLADDQFRRLISNGIAKINYYTAPSDLAAQRDQENTKAENTCGDTGPAVGKYRIDSPLCNDEPDRSVVGHQCCAGPRITSRFYEVADHAG